MNYWLMKSEPDEFSIDDLQSSKHQKTAWQGIRNYQARNFLRDGVKQNDLVFFYHSSCKEPAIVGLAEISQAASIDISAFDEASAYFDAKSTLNNPKWIQVELHFMAKFEHPITLKQLKADPQLTNMVLVAKGARLSVQPVTADEFDHIMSLSR